jgi:hypothetical protein
MLPTSPNVAKSYNLGLRVICGWDSRDRVRADEPSFSKELVWTLRVCPRCAKEVYETAVVRMPICSCGHTLGHPGPCLAVF